jgi:hypothetical protein
VVVVPDPHVVVAAAYILAYIYPGMKGPIRKALATIQHCVHAGRYHVLPHFLERLDQRGLFWPDVQAVLDKPASVRPAGRDDWGRDKWLVLGRVVDGLDLEIVCVLDLDEAGDLVVFITIHTKGADPA